MRSLDLLDRSAGRLPRRVRTLLDWALTIAVAVGLVLACEAEVAAPYRVPSASMEPTVHCAKPGDECEGSFADRIIVCKLCFRLESPSRGQIVAFDAPARAQADCGAGGTYLKRLIGLPGDVIREDRHARIRVDGRKLAEPYVTAAARAADTRFRGRTWVVPDGSYFMLGDNRGDSCDSRTWGAVPRGSLIGPVVATYWPPTRIGTR